MNIIFISQHLNKYNNFTLDKLYDRALSITECLSGLPDDVFRLLMNDIDLFRCPFATTTTSYF